MTPPVASTATEGGRPTVCTACPMLCDDVVMPADGPVASACEIGIRSFASASRAAAVETPAWREGRPIDLAAALDQAAGLLRGSRRVLTTGLAGATLEAIARACDLAECLGAAVDAGTADGSRPAGPTIARVGEVTAAWEELRDRADLVVFWFCDPSATHPRFIERFVRPAVQGGRGRRSIAVGPAPVLPPASLHRHLPLPRVTSVEAARMLHQRLASSPGPGAAHDRSDHSTVDAAVAEIERAIRHADCVAVVTADADDAVGLEAWSVAHLVRRIAHGKPAFGIPLGSGVHSGGGNVAGAAMVCTWRYGAAGGIARADRMGAECLPGECDARRLIERGDIDCLLAIGPLAARIEQAVRDRRGGLSIVRLDAVPPEGADAEAATIRIRCGGTLPHATGSMLREDGLRVVLPGCGPPATPPLEEILDRLEDLIRGRSRAGQEKGSP